MYVLKFYAIDIHGALIRLLDRIRVSGAQLVAVDAKRHQDRFAVVIRFRADNGRLGERLANQVSRFVGVTAVSEGCDRASGGDLPIASTAFVHSDMPGA
jgi:acetolactate synthase regulatory subunit